MKKTNRAVKVVIVILIVVAFMAGLLTAFFAIYAYNSRANLIVNGWVEKRFYVEESAMTNAIDQVIPAVVSISVQKTKANQDQELTGGTGFIFDKTGLILTNKHVVKRNEADGFTVTLNDKREFTAKILAEDPFDDVAILKIVAGEEGSSLPEFPVVKLGDSAGLKLGQKVLVIGNALVKYSNSVAAGIVSALNRDISAYYYDFKGPSENLSGLIQTDAPVNYGNSGGPLINLQGEVIGMVTALEESAEGIGFAIPVDDLKPSLESFKEFGEIIRPALGVRFVMLDKKQAQEIDPSLSYGALLVSNETGIKDAVILKSNAYKAGLREGDVILSVNDQVLDVDHSLQSIIKKMKVGDSVKLKVWHQKQEKVLDILLNSSKDFAQ